MCCSVGALAKLQSVQIGLEVGAELLGHTTLLSQYLISCGLAIYSIYIITARGTRTLRYDIFTKTSVTHVGGMISMSRYYESQQLRHERLRTSSQANALLYHLFVCP